MTPQSRNGSVSGILKRPNRTLAQLKNRRRGDHCGAEAGKSNAQSTTIAKTPIPPTATAATAPKGWRLKLPAGQDLIGLLIYAEDGHFSVQWMQRGRPQFSTGDIAAGSVEELAAAARGYFAYSGKFTVDAVGGMVIHNVEISLIPNWTGTQQRRHARIWDDYVELSSSPIAIGGEPRAAYLTLRRERVGRWK